MKKFLALLLLFSTCAQAQVPIYTRPAVNSFASGVTVGGVLCGSASFAPCLDLGNLQSSQITIARTDTQSTKYMTLGYDGSNTRLSFTSSGLMSWSSSATDSTATRDVIVSRDAAATLALANGTNAQTFRVYGTTTGPKYLALNHDGTNANISLGGSSGILFMTVPASTDQIQLAIAASPRLTVYNNGITVNTGSVPNQIRFTQTTAPTCTANCGTSPTVTGTDNVGTITMGATGVPASGFVLTFAGTWAAAPSCVVQAALGTMVVGKMPIAIAITTTTITVTTNGTAPSVADKYTYICFGTA